MPQKEDPDVPTDPREDGRLYGNLMAVLTR